VFEARSPYQKVQIVHSKSLGNLLVLDELQSKSHYVINFAYYLQLIRNSSADMSEADLIYTETLMQRGKENYAGKEIVILGGGDGGLLWELLKEKPKFVTMLEVRELNFTRKLHEQCTICFYIFLQIDDIVMQACSQHMRSICGDCLDKRKGDNYEVRLDLKFSDT